MMMSNSYWQPGAHSAVMSGSASVGNCVRRLALLLLPEFSNFGLAAVTEPLFVANWLAQDRLFEWRTLSVDGRPVKASNGSAAAVDGDLGLPGPFQSVFVLASFEPARTARNRAVTRWLKRLAREGVELVGIENGSMALAEAGLLDSHAAAVHWDNLPGFQELFPKIRIAPAQYSFSRNRATCTGAFAILEMMSAWLAQKADPEIAVEVSRHLNLPRAHASARAPGHERGDAVVSRALTIMQLHVDDPLSCEELARELKISLRQLERRFKQERGRTLHAQYMLVRVEKAHQYLQQTDLSVTEVAALSGFSSVEYFSKVYARVFGVLPSRDRLQSTQAPVFRMKV
jgi:AraC family transcriptional regulator, carnitine catabolism transcriptional activator